MQRMFFYHNYEDLHHVFGKITVRFVETDDELTSANINQEACLGRGPFIGQIPTCSLVEMFVRRAYQTGPGEGGNDWVFENAWQAPVSREQAFVNLYGKAPDHIKENNEALED